MKKLYGLIYKLFYGVYPIGGSGGSKKTETQIVAMPQQPPAPSATESAADVYKARMQYDPLIAQQEFQIQQQQMPQMTALETALAQQYAPQLAQLYTNIQQQQMPQLQALQSQLFPQQSQVIEAGAGRALERLQSPFGYTPEEETALGGIRQRQRDLLVESLRNQANLGGGLFGGRAMNREQQALAEQQQGFGAEDINRRLQGDIYAQQAANPYINILYPQAATQQFQTQPFQYQSTAASPDTLYNAMFQAGRRDYGIQPGQAGTPSPLWGLAGSAAGGIGAGFGGAWGKSIFG